MAEDEDDYLSDKFLVETSSAAPQPKTYAQRRKEAQKLAHIKNEENRHKSRRQLEQESREEGLSKSLFERAKEEEESGIGTGNKALSMMMKMGFKHGQSLGKLDDTAAGVNKAIDIPLTDAPGASKGDSLASQSISESKIPPKHTIEPLPINEWMGRKGIGLGKRARGPSPTSAERVAKMAKMAETTSHQSFRDRARQEYRERQAEGRLIPAQRTCETLDEKAEITFNVLWLNPQRLDAFPEGLLDVLSDIVASTSHPEKYTSQSNQMLLRRQMQADALKPLDVAGENEEPDVPDEVRDIFTPETIEEANQFLHLNAQDRLHLVLAHLRDKHAYCFWCGTQYETQDEMDVHCPGPEEEEHD